MGASRKSWRTGSLLAAISALGPSSAYADDSPYFPDWPIELQSDVVKISRGFPGEFALYVKDLSDGAHYTYNAATPMYLASGVKVAVMVALFRKIERGETTLETELVYGPDDLRDGAPLLSYLRVGTPVSLKLLLEAMIQQSDNAATDMIIRHVGLENVNKGLVDEGVFGFGPITTLLDVRHHMFRELDPRADSFTVADIAAINLIPSIDGRVAKIVELLGEQPGHYDVADFDKAAERYYASGLNTAPVESMAALLERIVRGKAVSETASKKMVEVMLGTETGSARIRGGLPISIPLAHKTGTQYQRIGDFGVFFLAGERSVIFAATVKGGRSAKQAEEVIGKLANRTYWHMASPNEREALKKRVPKATGPIIAEGDGGDLEPGASVEVAPPTKKGPGSKLRIPRLKKKRPEPPLE